MSNTSQWPLTERAVRQITPNFVLNQLQRNALTRACYPTAFGYYPNAQGHAMQRDQHTDCLLIYCVDGAGYIQTEKLNCAIKAGDVALLPPGTAHYYRADDEKPWSIYWLHFSGQQMQQLIIELDFQADQIAAPIGLRPLLISDFKRLIGLQRNGYRQPVYNYAAAITRQILHFLALEIRSHNQQHKHNFNIEALQQTMLDSILGELDLDTLATQTGLSRNHFANKYKKLTGISPIKHFINLKMEHACHLLDISNRSAKQISNDLGYNDPLYFSRVFKKVIGISPTEYRQRQRG